MGIIMRGKELTQEQLDAIVPVINAHMIGRISKKKFEPACIEAMDKAGCPLIQDESGDEDAAS